MLVYGYSSERRHLHSMYKVVCLSPALQRRNHMRRYHSVISGHVAVFRIAPLIISCRLQPVGVY